MPLGLDTAPWVATGSSASSLGILTEDTSDNRHSVYQDVQPLVDTGQLGTNVIYRAKVRPLGRTKCWIGCRQNNGLWMVSFDLTGGGTVLTVGTNVSSASITDNGDGSYICRVNYAGTFSTSATVFAIGALIADATQTYVGTGIDALEITEAQMIQGTQVYDYVPTTDRETYEDQATTDGLQTATLPAANRPNTMHPEYTVFAGGDPLDIDDWAYDADAITVCIDCDWDGNTSAEKALLTHTGASQFAFKAVLTAAGKFQVSLSSNGTAWQKVYTAVKALDVNTRTLCSFTWDGTTLRMYYNDVELTTGTSELTKDSDSALSGNLHDSTAGLQAYGGHYGKAWQTLMYRYAASASEIDSIASAKGLSGLPVGGGGGGTDPFPTTLAAMVDWLLDKGVTSGNIRYVDNLSGSDSNTGLSTSTAWATIQKAANTLTAGQAVIIRGRNGRFYEQVTIGASGTSGNKIWYVGDPENPPIMDATQAFSQTWTDMGSNRWRAPYGLSRPYSASSSYYTTCTTGNCRDELLWISHQITHNNVQLRRISEPSVPATFNEGECYFQVGTGSYNTPQYVWVRLPGDANPNSQTLRVGSSKTKLFDYSPFNWSQDGVSFPGGTSGQETSGRDHIALVNMHFFGGSMIRKVAPVSFRGTGWYAEHCSFMGSNTIGLTIHGTNHTIYNCNFSDNGQQSAFWAYADGVTMQRCRMYSANVHLYPGSWEAGHMKIVESAQNTRCEIFECLFDGCLGASAIWWDVDVGAGNPSEEAFFVHHCYFRENAKGQVFFERRCEFLKLEDSVVWNGKADNEGQSANVIGSGLRFQACQKTTLRRVVVAYNEGKGVLYKPDDGDSPCNNDVIDRCTFIQNCRGSSLGTISQGLNEFQGGDDPNYPAATWDTSVITNMLVSNNISGVSNFRRRSPGITDTDSAATFEGWNSATGTTVVTDPATVVSDYTDERGCYDFLPAYAAWAPQGFTHPDDFDTVWTSPS